MENIYIFVEKTETEKLLIERVEPKRITINKTSGCGSTYSTTIDLISNIKEVSIGKIIEKITQLGINFTIDCDVQNDGYRYLISERKKNGNS